MVLEDLQRVLANQMSVIVMDPKGELTDVIKRLALFKGNDRLVVIEPDDDIAINPLDIDAGSIEHTVDAINYLFSSFAEQLTELQGTLLRPTIRALLTGYSHPTLETLQQLLAGGLKSERGAIVGPFLDFAQNHPDPDLRSFLMNEFTSDTVYRETKGQVLRRLRSLRNNQIIRRWFTCEKSKFSLAKEIDDCKAIVINNSRELLTPQGAEFFGRFFIAQLRAAGERRKTNDPRNVPTLLYIDECDQVIKTDNNIEDYIDKLRSKHIGIVLAHQRLYHFEGNKATLDALLNAPIRFASADDDAEALVKRFRVNDPSDLRFDEPGYFAAYIRQHKPETAILRVTKPALAFMTEAEHSAIRVRMRDRYGSDKPKQHEPDQPEKPPSAPAQTHTEEKKAPVDDTLFRTETLSPKHAKAGTSHIIHIFADPAGNKKSISVTIPPNTTNGTRMRLRGVGRFRKDGTRGDIELTIRVPNTTRKDDGDIPDPDEIG